MHNRNELVWHITGISLFLFTVIGYIANIVNLLTNSDSISITEAIISIAGIFIGPVGVITGWLYLVYG